MRTLWTQAVMNLIIVCSSAVLFTACYRSPAVAQAPPNLVDDAAVVALSNQQYAAFLLTYPPITGTQGSLMVEKVGNRMAAAVREYLAATSRPGLMDSYRWEFTLVDNGLAAAWSMPGGRVVIYSGILPYSMTEGGLATVMGHEMAHAIAWHGRDRMNQVLVQRYGGVPLSAVLLNRPGESQNVFNAAYGVTSTQAALAFSRTQEYEADELGLYFMAMAGYNPAEAVAFWKRMAVLGDYNSHPEFLSTHPSDQNRISYLYDLIPRAMQYYPR